MLMSPVCELLPVKMRCSPESLLKVPDPEIDPESVFWLPVEPFHEKVAPLPMDIATSELLPVPAKKTLPVPPSSTVMVEF